MHEEAFTWNLKWNGIFLFYGLFVGTAGALAGMGGGFLIVPFLLALGYTSRSAPPTSLSAVFLLATSALIGDALRGYVDYRLGVPLGIGGILGAQIGSRLSHRVPTHVFRKIFSVILLFLGIYLFLSTLFAEISGGRPVVTLAAMNVYWIAVMHVAFGAVIGIIASFVGLGGGFIVVPYLLYIGLRPTEATGTAFLFVIVVALSTVYTHVKKKSKVNFIGALFLGAGGIVGAQMGELILPHIPGTDFKRGFACVLVLLALYVFFKKTK